MKNVHSIDTRRGITEQLLQELPEIGQTQVGPDLEPERAERARLDAEARHANALARVKYSEETATALSQAVNGPVNELAHAELRTETRRLVMEFCQLLEDNGLDFHKKQFAGDLCWKFGSYVDSTQQNIDRVDTDITRLVNDGGEISMRQATRRLNFRDQLEHQLNLMLDLKEAAEDAFFDITGRAYMPPAKPDAHRVDVAAARVKMIAERVAKQKAAAAPAAAEAKAATPAA